MIILGVDPGSRHLGYAVIEVSEKKIYLRDLGSWKSSRNDSLDKRLLYIHQFMEGIFKKHMPVHVAIEEPFYGKNVKTVLRLGEVMGIIRFVSTKFNAETYTYAPRTVKQCVIGNGSATKQQVLKMLDSIFNGGIITGEHHDQSDALAVAYCHAQHCKTGEVL